MNTERQTRPDGSGTNAFDAPLTAPGFDAMDLLVRLTDVAFERRVLVLAPHLIDVPLVRADVSAQAPALNVDVIALDGNLALHLLSAGALNSRQTCLKIGGQKLQVLNPDRHPKEPV